MPDGYQIWIVDNKPVSVRLRNGVGRQVRALAGDMSGFESGGILWGRAQDTGDGHFVVSIERAETVRCEHTRGESWALSERDRRELVTRLAVSRGDLQPLGFWRSHLRRGLYLDNRDMDLMQTYFAKPYCLAMCARESGSAGFFIWEQGDIRRTSSYREFQLPDAGQPPNVSLPHPSPEWKNWAAGIAACLVMAAPVYIVSRRSPATPAHILDMQAETRPGGVVRLTWNPSALPVRNTSSAVVSIVDGLDENKLELTPAQVRTGALDYEPSYLDVNFRLQIGRVVESLRLSITNSMELPIVTVGRHTWTLQHTASVKDFTVRRSHRRIRKVTRSVRRLEIARLAHRKGVEEREIEVPSPPAQVTTELAELQTPPIAEAPPKVPTVVASLEKPAASPLKRAFGWMLPVRKDFVEAKPIMQVQPEAQVEEETSVAVRVEIDRQGVVRDADLVSKQVEDDLGRSALEAAKRWVFEPARADHRPVASNIIVRFQFAAYDPGS